jgi:ferredoxin-NADP reductase
MGRPLSGAVTATRRETRDTVTLELTADEGPHAYRAGQFLTIDPHQFPQLEPLLGDLEARKGRREAPRAYSLSSAPHEPSLAITIKEEPLGDYPPLLSPLLMNGLPAGSRLVFKGFDGLYTLPEPADHDLVLHLCSGSGIVPNFGLIKDALHRGFKGRQLLLYQSPTLEDVIFRKQLAALETAHAGRISMRHFLGSHIGRPDLERALAGASNPLVFLCGPGIPSWEQQAARKTGIPPAPRFVERLRAELKSIGLDRQNLRTEIFG